MTGINKIDGLTRSQISVVPAQAGIKKKLKIQRYRIKSGITPPPFYDLFNIKLKKRQQ